MAYAYHSMTTIQVEVFLTLVVPDFTTFALDNVDIEERIYIK